MLCSDHHSSLKEIDKRACAGLDMWLSYYYYYSYHFSLKHIPLEETIVLQSLN